MNKKMVIEIFNIEEVVKIEKKHISPFYELLDDCVCFKHLNSEDVFFLILPFTQEGFLSFDSNVRKLIIEKLRKYPSIFKIILFNGYGDYVYKNEKEFKDFNIIYFSLGGNRSLGRNYYGYPVMWGDPLTTYFNIVSPLFRQKSILPVVGFCGQGKSSLVEYVYRIFNQFFFNIKSLVCLSEFRTESLIPSTFLRSKILKRLKKSNLIEANFKIHNRYKGGVSSRGTLEEFEVRKQFYENINRSDYTICIRGQGNFSVRFYETMAMGRIPIVYDTDQLWPFINSINYPEVGLFIDASKFKIKDIPFLISNYHNSLSDQQFNEKQRLNRSIWLDYMTKEGLKINLSKCLSELL